MQLSDAYSVAVQADYLGICKRHDIDKLTVEIFMQTILGQTFTAAVALIQSQAAQISAEPSAIPAPFNTATADDVTAFTALQNALVPPATSPTPTAAPVSTSTTTTPAAPIPVTAIAFNAGIVTLTTGVTSNLAVGSRFLLAGSDVGSDNAVQVATNVTSTSVSFASTNTNARAINGVASITPQ